MYEVLSFDPLEFKVYQTFLRLLQTPSAGYKAKLNDLVFRQFFYKLELNQRANNDEFH